MKINKTLLAISLSMAAIGVANAASVSKKITLTAQINDALFVSKPDGSTWYGTEELEATDYKQTRFKKTLPIRVWSKNAEFNVSLAQPLLMSNGFYQMRNAEVKITSGTGEGKVATGTPLKITQTTATADGFDDIHNVLVQVDAPIKLANGADTNGSYSGDLVMVFEPVAATSPPTGP